MVSIGLQIFSMVTRIQGPTTGRDTTKQCSKQGGGSEYLWRDNLFGFGEN